MVLPPQERREDADDERPELHAALPAFLPEEYLSCPTLPTSAAVSGDSTTTSQPSPSATGIVAGCARLTSSTWPTGCPRASDGPPGISPRRPSEGRARILTGSSPSSQQPILSSGS